MVQSNPYLITLLCINKVIRYMSGYARFLLRLLFENKVFKDNSYMFFIFHS